MNAARVLSFDLDETLLDGSGFRDAVARTCDLIASAESALNGAELFQANNEAFTAYWPEIESDWTLRTLDTESLSLEIWRRALLACRCDDTAIVSWRTRHS